MKNTSGLIIIILFYFSSYYLNGQDANTVKVWRINFLNPAIELELPTSDNSSFSSSLGIGYGGAYPQTSFGGSGFLYSFNPFLDLQQKWFYNFSKRKSKNLSIENNSGNFVSARLLTRGKTIDSNFNRTTDFDFAFGPTWGFQRKYGENFHFLFDVGGLFTILILMGKDIFFQLCFKSI